MYNHFVMIVDHEGSVILGGTYTVITPMGAERPPGPPMDSRMDSGIPGSPPEIFLSEEDLAAAGWTGGRAVESEATKPISLL